MLLCVMFCVLYFFFFNDPATTEIYTYEHTLSLHDALPIWRCRLDFGDAVAAAVEAVGVGGRLRDIIQPIAVLAPRLDHRLDQRPARAAQQVGIDGLLAQFLRDSEDRRARRRETLVVDIARGEEMPIDRKHTRLNSRHQCA